MRFDSSHGHAGARGVHTKDQTQETLHDYRKKMVLVSLCTKFVKHAAVTDTQEVNTISRKLLPVSAVAAVPIKPTVSRAAVPVASVGSARRETEKWLRLSASASPPTTMLRRLRATFSSISTGS